MIKLVEFDSQSFHQFVERKSLITNVMRRDVNNPYYRRFAAKPNEIIGRYFKYGTCVFYYILDGECSRDRRVFRDFLEREFQSGFVPVQRYAA